MKVDFNMFGMLSVSIFGHFGQNNRESHQLSSHLGARTYQDQTDKQVKRGDLYDCGKLAP